MKRRLIVAVWLALAASAAALLGQAPPPAKRPVFHIRPTAIFNEHLYEGTLESATGIAVDERSGEVWVTDTKNNLVGCFTREGVPLFAFGSDRLREPTKIAVDGEGRVWVLDNDRSILKLFSYRGEPLETPALAGLGAKPSFGAVAFDAEGNLYVGENESCQVLVFGPDGKPRGRFGECGIEPGQFQAITGIAADKERIVVTDAQAVSVQVFDRKGNFVRGWGAHDMGIQNFSLPQGVALDSKGHVVAVDMLRHEIKFFDAEGNFLERFGGLGRRAGQVAFPAGIAIDSADRIFVVEKGNSRVQAFVEVDGPFPSDNASGANAARAPLRETGSTEKEVPRKSPEASEDRDPASNQGLLQQKPGGQQP